MTADGDPSMASTGFAPPQTPPPDPELLEDLAGRLEALQRFCRVKVEGLENLPSGRAVLAANHTGWAGLDHVNLALAVHQATGRIPRTAVHPSWFHVPWVRDVAPKLGFFEVSVTEGTRLLDAGDLVLMFPEGEAGNQKPFWKLYELQPFHPGFARLALAAEAPVVPVAVVGGEEANLNLGRFHVEREGVRVPLPIPLNLLPLPVKWRLRFLEPIPADRWLEGENPDQDLGEIVASEVRGLLQEAVDELLRERGNPFF